jgi:hypothetical protein
MTGGIQPVFVLYKQPHRFQFATQRVRCIVGTEVLLINKEPTREFITFPNRIPPKLGVSRKIWPIYTPGPVRKRWICIRVRIYM